MILHIDREKEKIALGLKQKQASPWENVDEKYPVGSVRQGHGRQRDELRRLREARRRASKAWCTSAKCRGPSASTIRANWCRSATRSTSWSSASTRTSRRSRSA